MGRGRKPIGDRPMTATERSRRHREKFRGEKPKPQTTTADTTVIAALRAELARAKARIAEMVLERAAQAQAFRDEVRRRAHPARADRGPLPPDEARDRRIKALTTENRNLKLKVRHLEEEFDERVTRAGGLTRKEENAIIKVLHNDQRGNATEADKDEACKAFLASRRRRRPTR